MMNSRDLVTLVVCSVTIAVVAGFAGLWVRETTQSDALMGIALAVLIGAPTAALGRWGYMVNRRAGSDPVPMTSRTLYQLVGGFALLTIAVVVTYASYALGHDRWLEAGVALVLTIPNAAFQMASAKQLPPLKPHEMSQTRFAMVTIAILPPIFAINLAMWLADRKPSPWPVMHEANIAAYFVLISLMPVVFMTLRNRYVAARDLTALRG